MAKGPRVTVPSSYESSNVAEHPDRGRIEALMDKNLAVRIRSERSASYWFAASLWGMSGLVVGALMGAAFMFTSMRAAVPVALEAQSQAIAQERGRQQAESRHEQVTNDSSNSSSQSAP